MFVNASQRPSPQRLLLSELRGGDHAHPGDAEALELIVKKVRELAPYTLKDPILDVGCGFGGTLDYLQKKGCKKLFGIDLNVSSITYARQKYPGITFEARDALLVNDLFEKSTFGLVLAISSLYAIQDKRTCLAALNRVARQGALLVIFDYTALHHNASSLPVCDFSGKEIYPLHLPQLAIDLHITGWLCLEQIDLTKEFIRWYEEFLTKLNEQSPSLITKYGKQVVEQVESTFSYFLTCLKAQKMGGAVVCAQKRGSSKL